MKYIKNISFILIIQLLGGVLSIATNLFLAWTLSPSEKGIVAVFVAMPNLLVIMLSMGLQISTTYWIARDKSLIKDVFSITLLLVALINSCFIFFAWLCFPLFQFWLFKGMPLGYTILALTTVPAILFIFCTQDIFWVLGKKYYFIILKLSSLGSYFLLTLWLVLWLEQGVFGAIIAFTISSYLTAFLTLGAIISIISFSFNLNLDLCKKIIQDALPAYFGKLAQQGIYRLDTPLINYFLGSQAMGFYSIALPLTELIWHIPQATGFILMPSITKLEGDEATLLTSLSLRHALYLSSLAGLVLFFVITLLIYFFIPQYTPAIELFAWLLPGAIIANVFQIITNDWIGRGKTYISTWISIFSLGCAIILYSIAIFYNDLRMVAIASSLTYFIEAMAFAYIWSCYHKISLSQLFILTQSDISIYGRLISQFISFCYKIIKNKEI